jgi:hypothetical protein
MTKEERRMREMGRGKEEEKRRKDRGVRKEEIMKKYEEEKGKSVGVYYGKRVGYRQRRRNEGGKEEGRGTYRIEEQGGR